MSPPRTRRFSWLSREGLFFSVYAIVTFVMTYPVLFRMGSVFYGLPEDPLLFQWMFWYMAKGGGGWVLGKVPIIGYPSGVDLSFWAREMGIFVPGRILTWLFGQTFAYNLLILVGFILSGIFMYYLIRHLTYNATVSFLAGLAYAFCPYHLEHAMVHVNLASIEWLPLFFLCFLKLIEKRSWMNAVLSAVTFSVVALSDFHYGLFAAMLAVIILIVKSFFALKEKRTVQFNGAVAIKVGVGLLIVAALVAPFFITLASESNSAAYYRRRGQADLIKFSARPLEYFLPAAANPFLGRLTRGYEYSHLHGAEEYETSNYLGFVILALAVVGLVLEWKRRSGGKRRRNRLNGDADRETRGGLKSISGEDSKHASAEEPQTKLHDFGRGQNELQVCSYAEAGSPAVMVWSMVAGAVIFFILSMPPYFSLGSTRIYLPSELLHRVLPLFRSYSRFSLMVLFCMIVLAAYGLEGLLERGWFRKHAGVFVATLAVLVLLEYAIVPPFRYTEVRPPPEAFAWIAGQNISGPIAAYPMDQKGWYVYKQLYGQTTHRKTMINAGGLPYGVDPQYQYLIDLMHPYTPRVLAQLGVREAVVIPSMWQDAVSLMAPRYAGSGFPQELLPAGYNVERVFNDGLVLRVTSNPAVLIPHFEQGFEEPYLVNNAYYRQRLNHLGKIRMQNTTGAVCKATLTFDASAAQGTVRLEATLDGRPAGSWEVGSREKILSTPVLSFRSGDSNLRLKVSSLGGETDTALSVSMSALNVKTFNVSQ